MLLTGVLHVLFYGDALCNTKDHPCQIGSLNPKEEPTKTMLQELDLFSPYDRIVGLLFHVSEH